MKKISIILTIMLAIILIVAACNENGDTINVEDLVGYYEINAEAADYEYQYVELYSDNTWIMVYKVAQEQEQRVSGTYAIANDEVVFSGNAIAEDIAIVIEDDSVSVSYEGTTYDKTSVKTMLATPVVSIDINEINWPAISNADTYLIYDGQDLIATQSENTFDLSELERFNAGTHYDITVIARDSNENYRDSNPSYEVDYYISLPQLATPQNLCTDDSYHMTWSEVSHAIGYIVYKDGDFMESLKGSDNTFFAFSIGEPGTYTLSVAAIGDQINYSDSALATATFVMDDDAWATELSAPSINMIDGTISWDDVTNAESYNLYCNGFLHRTNVASPYTVEMFYQGTYELAIMAMGDIVDYTNSTLSNPVNYTKAITGDTLISPVITLDMDTLSWDEVQGADEYAIMEGSSELATITDTYYNLPDFDFEPSSVHSLSVIAKSLEESINDSAASNVVEYTVPEPIPLPAPCELEQGGGSYLFFTDYGFDFTTHYKIYVDGTLHQTIAVADVEDASMSSITVLVDETTLEAGDYDVQVQACDDTGDNGDSPLSDICVMEFE